MARVGGYSELEGIHREPSDLHHRQGQFDREILALTVVRNESQPLLETRQGLQLGLESVLEIRQTQN